MFSTRRIATFIALMFAATLGYASAQEAQQKAPPPSAVTADAPARPAVTGKWDTQIYGFIELDTIWDNTQSMTEIPGNPAIAKPGTYAAGHDRLQFTPRNTRLGFRFASPEYYGLKVTGLLETDFFGTQPAKSGDASESAYYSSALLRIRHAYFVIKSAPVDVLIGQTWNLFGWQSYFQPATVELQGVPGEVYSRQPQIRLSHMFKTDPVSVDVAVAAARGQRDSGVPDGQAGIRFLFNDLKGLRTVGGTGTSVDAAAIGVSGLARRFAEQVGPVNSTSADGWGYSVDLLLPIIPATMEHRDNGLTINVSFQNTAGAADYYTGFSGGVPATAGGTFGSPTASGPNSVWLDSNLAYFNGTHLKPVQWRGVLAGLQYHLPAVPLWVSGNFSQMYSPTIAGLRNGVALGGAGATGAQSNLWTRQNWYEADLFWDVTPAARLGLAYARFMQTYAATTTAAGLNADNNRFQLSGWYVF